MDRLQHSIQMAAKKSGLSPHVIRVWERRYGAVLPSRTGTNRRLYSEAEVERLALLRHAVAAGHRISNIARLSVEDLRRLASDLSEVSAERSPLPPGNARGEVDHCGVCLEAIRRMDANELEGCLTRALVAMGHQGLLRLVVAPLTRRIGEEWERGLLTAAHEHFASAFLRTFLGHGARPFALTESTPTLLVATPSGQLHELGAVIIASAARNLGWRVIYLGVNLPAAEIAGAAVQNRVRAVALSLVYPTDDPELSRELGALRRFLPSEVVILVGGRASWAYRDGLNQVGAFQSEDLDAFCRKLDELRQVRGGG